MRDERYTPVDPVFAERAILGRMLRYSESLAIGLMKLEASDFTHRVRREAFELIELLAQERAPINMESVGHALLARRDQTFQRVMPELLECGLHVVGPANADYYAAEVSQNGRLLRLQARAREAVSSTSNVEDAAAMLERATREAMRADSSRPERMGDVLARRLHALADEADGKADLPHVSTGINAIDKRGGMRGGELWVIAGRPGSGKTALALQISEVAARVATKTEQVLFFSLEMSKSELAERVLARNANVSATKIRAAKIEQGQWGDLRRAAVSFEQLPLEIVDDARMTMSKIVTIAERANLVHRVTAIYVDYIQLVRVGQTMRSREQEVSHVARELKTLARVVNCPVIALCAMNRAVESRANNYPTLGDLRESGEIEQAADVVMFVHRPALFDSTHAEEECDLYFAKCRHGGRGRTPVRFVPNRTTFENIAE